MLSDDEADAISRGRAQGTSGPIVGKWVDQLLADRRDRITQLENSRKRLDQAFRYLDGLVKDAQRARGKSSNGGCPRCGK